jgi:molybdate transport system substrate-binding protein
MVRAGSAIALARVGIGVVVRQGAASPDISTAAAIRKLLLDAHSIVYPDPEAGGGYAGRAIARMIDRMDVAAVVKPKLTLRSAIGGGVELVARGKVEVGLFNISEIIPIKGVTLVGPLPAELQSYIVFSAAITANSSTPKPDVAFIRMLAGPLAGNAWQKAGLELMGKGPTQAQ